MFRKAIDIEYAWTLSVQRLSSIYSGHYSIEEIQKSRVLGSETMSNLQETTLRVQFQKGTGKSYHGYHHHPYNHYHRHHNYNHNHHHCRRRSWFSSYSITKNNVAKRAE